MTLTPWLRKLVLTVHLTVSVGWIGAVIAYLAAVIAAMRQPDAGTLRAVWLALDVIGWAVIVPLALAALLTGLIMAIGTPWGLFRHYWVTISLVLTTAAVAILLQHMGTVSAYADLAVRTPQASAAGLPGELLHAGLGLAVLMVVQVLNVFKPKGLTAYGWRKQMAERAAQSSVR